MGLSEGGGTPGRGVQYLGLYFPLQCSRFPEGYRLM